MLLHAQALPNVGDLQANLDAMSAAVARYPIVCWKVFTNFPDLYDGSGNAWRLDDGDPSLAAVGDAFLAPRGRARRADRRRAQGPVDHARLLVAATRRPPTSARPHARIPTCASSCTTRASRPTSSRARTTRRPPTGASNRLIASMQAAGIGPNQNVYAELGTTWWSLLARPG